MSLSDSELAYLDCYEALDRAMSSGRGVRMGFADRPTAQYFQARCHQARKIRRKKNRTIYPDFDHPLHGRSEYDVLRLTFEDGDDIVYLYIRKNEFAPVPIEDLDEIEPMAEPPRIAAQPQPQLMLPKPHEDFANEPEAPTIRRRG